MQFADSHYYTMKYPVTSNPTTTTENKTGSWKTHKPKIDLDKCIGCGMCARVCPESCIKMIEMKKHDKDKPKTDYDYCKGCGACAAECPVKCIEMEPEIK